MPDEVVSCEDMSRGGLRFKSKKQFYASTMIEVAVPYSPGGQSIFVPGQIVYVHESPGEGVFHCGVAYRRSSRWLGKKGMRFSARNSTPPSDETCAVHH